MDKDYMVFILEPLREFSAGSRSLDEAVLKMDIGYRNFEQYRVSRHRQWLLTQIPAAMAAAESARKDREKGQQTMF